MDSYFTQARPSSRTSSACSYGSIDSGVSHPPKKGPKRKKRVDMTWGEVAGQKSDTDAFRVDEWLNAEATREQARIGSRPPSCSSTDEYYSEDDDDAVQSFYCPFYRRSPPYHPSCMDFHSRRIRDVKQHVLRKHASPPSYATTYEDTFYKAVEDANDTRSSTLDPHLAPMSIPVDGLLPGVEEKLRCSIDRRRSPADQWYMIWDLLFEDLPRPDDPYYNIVKKGTASPPRMHRDETDSPMEMYWNPLGIYWGDEAPILKSNPLPEITDLATTQIEANRNADDGNLLGLGEFPASFIKDWENYTSKFDTQLEFDGDFTNGLSDHHSAAGSLWPRESSLPERAGSSG